MKLYILGSTPRSIYELKYGPQTVTWGTLFPSITLLVVIGAAIFIILAVLFDLTGIYVERSWILNYCAYNEWLHIRHFFPVLCALQIPLLVGYGATDVIRYGRTVLPQGHPPHICRIVR